MKHSIILKFIAILLCAAALLGLVGSAGGVIVLTAMDLYNQDVEDLLAQQLENRGHYYASQTASRYFSREAGGCPEQLVESIFPQAFLGYDWLLPISYGIILRDSQGNVLYDEVSDSLGEGAVLSLGPIYSQYAHLVDTRPESQQPGVQPGLSGVYRVTVSYDGASESIGSAGSPLGHLEFDEGGELICFRFLDAGTMVTEGTVTSVSFCGQDGSVLYSMDGTPGYVGEFIREDGIQVFLPYEIVVNDVPLEVAAPVYSANFYREGLSLDMRIGSVSDPVGQMTLDSQGNLHFLFWGSVPMEQPLRGLVLCDADGSILYDSRNYYDGGETDFVVTQEDGQTLITAGPNSAIALTAGTVPETAGEAVEETTGETVAETTAPDTRAAETTPETTAPVATAPEITLPEATEPLDLSGYQRHTASYYDGEAQEWMVGTYVYLVAEECSAELYYLPDSYSHPAVIELLHTLRLLRGDLFLTMGISALILAILAVYLCCAAGHRKGTQQIRAGGLNRLSLDVHLVLSGFLILGCAAGAALSLGYLTERSMESGVLLAAAAGYVGCLSLVGLGFAFVAQIKTPEGYWWRNLLTVRCVGLCWRLVKWCWQVAFRILPRWCIRVIRGLWRLVTSPLRALCKWLSRTVGRFFSLLPLTWQWLVGGGALLLLGLLSWANRNDAWGFIWLFLGVAVVLYAARCFASLFESARRMSQGDLESQVDSKHMTGCFREFAEDLNDLAGVAAVAAQKQLKSERMKTELITNVSHDIKTPLTSIINYVDLLQKPHTEQEQEKYLEVLSRQSLRLKKLIDDLMEMSKASTGNMTVELTTLDAVEAVNQALGEFADKLSKAGLTPVVRCSGETVSIRADGRLVWRVLSNLLSNAVKYAMPGTRLYVDLSALEGKVIISMKNISREELTGDAEELMERFVRGDDSRNTEGSGLGLNIAKSLMELQKGQLQLLVDGDLFKVTLIFPGP